MAGVDLSHAIGLPPKDAIAYFESKGHQLSWNWQDVWSEAQAKAFTVAKVARMDVLNDIGEAVKTALKEGKTERWFEQHLTPILKAKGWWGKKTVVDSQGNAERIQEGSPARLKLIYRQNLQTAYMAGRWKQMTANADSRPYWQYVAVMDSLTRPAHAALNGKIWRHDDPVWRHIYPPNGFNCRCRVRALNERDLLRKGRFPEPPSKLIQEEREAGLDKRTGEIRRETVTGVLTRILDDNGRHKNLRFFPDTGFDYSAGEAGRNYALRLLTQKLEAADPDLAARMSAAAVRFVLPDLLNDYRQWVQSVVQSGGKARGEAKVIGALTEPVLTFLKTAGQQVQTAAISIVDRDVIHLMRETKASAGRALQEADVMVLPQAINSPRAVLWDTQDPALLYVFDATDERLGKVVVRVNFTERLRVDGQRIRQPRNQVTTAGIVKIPDLSQSRYALVEGRL